MKVHLQKRYAMKQMSHRHLIPCLLLILSAGCMVTQRITTRTELHEQQWSSRTIRVLTIDSTLYSFSSFSIGDSSIHGKAIRTQFGRTDTLTTTIPFRKMAFIEGKVYSGAKAALIIPAVVCAAVIIAAITQPEELSMHHPYTGGSSCPYVYSSDSSGFHLEAEAFGTSISQALEGKSYHMLPSLAAVNERLTVRISNERPETHLINSVQLFAADAGNAVSIALDVDNTPWPLEYPIPPERARDHSGKTILETIGAIDGNYWESDLAHITSASGFRDAMEMEFDVPREASEATLVVRAINTELITEVYRSVGAILGDATLSFYHALETDTTMQRRIQGWLRECSLRIERETESGWEEICAMQPEANVAPFTRAVRIRDLKKCHGRLRLRLSTLTDVWRIDAVTLDCSPVKPVRLVPLEMLTVAASDGKSWQSAITANDSEYALVLPPDHLDVTFSAPHVASMKKPVYVFAAQGFLYEWFPRATEGDANAVTASLAAADRIALLKLLIGQKDIFLPPLYDKWKKAETKSESRKGAPLPTEQL